MCTWFYAEKATLSPIITKAQQLPLTDTIMNTMARSAAMSGNIRPTDMAAVFAPNKQGNMAVFPMIWGFTVEATMTLFDRIFDKTLLARRINLVACNVIKESDVPESESYEQLSLFDTEETIGERADDEKALEKERALQEAMLTIKHKFGKNAVLKGTNFTEGATAKERNRQIGGHKA